MTASENLMRMVESIQQDANRDGQNITISEALSIIARRDKEDLEAIKKHYADNGNVTSDLQANLILQHLRREEP